MSDVISNKPLSIWRTGIREETVAAAIIELDEYTIKTIFGDGTVLFEKQDPKSRMYVPGSIDFNTTKKPNDDYVEEENINTLESVGDDDIVIEDERFNLSSNELDELLKYKRWDDLSDALKKKIMSK